MSGGDPALSPAQRFAEVVRRMPDAPAVEDGDRVLTYRELDARAAAIARRLRARGAGPERTVAILVDRTADLPACVLATWRAGAAHLALDPQTPRARLRAVLAEVRPVAILTHGRLRHRLAGIPIPQLAVDRDAPDHGAPDRDALDHGALPEPDERDRRPDDVDVLAYLIYTSGSTGAPKGVGVSRRALLATLDDWIRLYGLGTDITSVLQVAGFGFDVATGDVARALLTGCRLVMCPGETLLSPPALHAFIRRVRPDLAEFTPSLLRPLVSHLLQTGQRLGSARCLVVGGENWTAADYRSLRAVTGPDVRIFNTYGLTETTIDCTYHETGAGPYEETGVPIGRPFAATELHVLDGDLRPAQEGELYVGGVRLARGYQADPATTAQRFVPSPEGPPGARLYRTGDRVRWLPGGELYYLGRRDDQVKVRGVRVHLAEVERALAAHPGVRAAVVVPHEVTADGAARTELAAYVIPAADRLDPGELHRHAARQLPPGMVPALVTVLDGFPVTPNGKVDRDRLPPLREWPSAQPLAPEPSAPEAFAPGASGFGTSGVVPPGITAGTAEAAVAGIWARVLGRAVPAAGADFWELGGNSLLAAQVAGLIRAELGAELPPAALLEHPTVAELARLVAGAVAGEPIPADPARTEGPLSPAQNRLWLLDRLAGGLADYNIPAVIRLTGPLDVPVLRAALRRLVDRHAVLRTAFLMTAGGPIQRVRQSRRVAVAGEDLLEIAEPGAAGIDGWIQEFARRPFDLSRPPLLRAALLPDGPGRVLALSMHHIVSDGWTLRILLRDLGIIYSALVQGTEPELPPLPFSYLDHSAWYAGRLERGDFDHQLAYWREHLAGVPPARALPPPTGPSDGGPRRTAATLGPDLTDAVRGLAREQRATVFVTLLTAFMTVLRRWSGGEDLVVGVPFGDRTVPGTEDLAGFFVNTVPLRAGVPGDAAFSDAVRLTRAAVAGAAQAQDVPFDLVQRELRRSGAGVPFRAWFNFLGPPDQAPGMAGLVTEMLPPPVVGALFDLNAYVMEGPDDLEIELIFDGGRCDEEHMSAFMEQFIVLLRRVAADPDAPLDRHTLTADPADPGDHGGETPAVESGAGSGPSAFPSLPSFSSLPSAVAAMAGRTPDAVAVRAPTGAVTYRQLSCWAGAVAGRLAGRDTGRDAGGDADDVVAVYAHRGLSLVAALLGVLEAGAAFLVLDPAYPPARLAAQIEEARPVALLHLAEAGPLPEELARRVPAVLAVPGTPEDGPPLRGTPARGLAYVAFTSGTTGRPRAARGDQGPVAHFLEVYARRFAICPGDRFAMLSGLAHDPLLRDVFAPLWTGATISVPPPDLIRAPRELLAWLAAERVTIAHLTPPLVRSLAGARGGLRLPEPLLPDLRLAVCGGDQLRWADVATLRGLAPGVVVVNAYGTTETPQVAGWHVVAPGEPGGPGELPVPIGRGVEGAELLVEGVGGLAAAVGEIGRIVVRTPHLTHGHDGRYDTGDLGRRQPDGSVVLTGRADDQVMIAGHRAEPAEIDLRAVRLPYVRDCVSVARRGPDGEARLVSYVVPAGAEPVGLARLRADLRQELPGHLLPAGIVVLQGLPMTPNGKVDRAGLPNWTALETGGEAPSTPLERRIAETWGEILRLRAVAADVNFFDLGGTSLLMAQVQQALRRRLGRDIPIVTLFAHPTVRSLAAHLSGSAAGHAPARAGRLNPVTSDAAQRRAIRRELRDKPAGNLGTR
ncbi:amino acid adenylation domain-containing protein [Planotetraspora sp. A-T 1434]|uniref:non-ribosomal peptide synthetase n=1 Tax=Planotetraspora sp. A-T 1434 TaxID=2979219 RepID=UPI0021BE9007|nr:non-ribosomal peptide synthetase [Planotetraspora sp. A-T 1434]MCT9932202.1 amino acid adenylation domain-containing protein [Planotetraspora sp. A-T 1434]